MWSHKIQALGNSTKVSSYYVFLGALLLCRWQTSSKEDKALTFTNPNTCKSGDKRQADDQVDVFTLLSVLTDPSSVQNGDFKRDLQLNLGNY